MRKKDFNEVYRPRSFANLVGQDEAVKIIRNLLSSGFLVNCIFVGPYGVGKTTAAIIIAYDFAERYWEESSFHQAFKVKNHDISAVFKYYNGREINKERIEHIKLLATTVGRRVILIDEADFMPKELQEKLRSIMEGKRNATFILSTNNQHNISEALFSRSVKIQFYPIPFDLIVQRLIHISVTEKLISNPVQSEVNKALEKIARQADGDLRMAINLLEASIGPNGLDLGDIR